MVWSTATHTFALWGFGHTLYDQLTDHPDKAWIRAYRADTNRIDANFGSL